MISNTLTRFREGVENTSARSNEGGYAVEVSVLKTSRTTNSPDGNPRYRFHTDRGVYATANDVQRSLSLTGEETGPAVLHIHNSRVIAWSFNTPGRS